MAGEGAVAGEGILAEVGEEIEVGEGSIVGSRTGTGTGGGGMEVGINQDLRVITRDTTPTARDRIMTATNLF